MSLKRTAVIVDEHPLWLDAVQQVLERVSVEVVAKATSLDDAALLVRQHRPALVVAEVATSTDDAAGVAWLREITQEHPNVKPIVLSTVDDSAVISAALEAGAVVYVIKKAHPDDLAVAIRQAYDHSIYLPGYRDDAARVPAVQKTEHPDLTRRELEILRLVAEGLSNAELAKMLWVTEQTVKFHLSNIYRKLNVSNRTEASRWAQLNGLLPAEPMRSALV
jgi:two-component system, NarL family, response regulator DevR